MLVDLLLVSLSVSVQLGVPVVVLFVAGYLAHRESHRQGDPREPLDRNREPATVGTAAKRVSMPDHAVPTDLGFRHCPPVDPAQGSLPCWQAVKTARGRLRSECLDCSLFLMPAKGRG
ncbi:MAG: hypothetical protein ACYC3S_14215 [Chloroflexota bacterium]